MMRSSPRDSPQSRDCTQQGLEDRTMVDEDASISLAEGGTTVREAPGWFMQDEGGSSSAPQH
jgi:hypothetical protein